MPRVRRISIAPVRGLGLEHPSSVALGATGVLEDYPDSYLLVRIGGRWAFLADVIHTT